jgi:hypothetical protein
MRIVLHPKVYSDIYEIMGTTSGLTRQSLPMTFMRSFGIT